MKDIEVRRFLGGCIYRRKIDEYSSIMTNEAAMELNITVRHLRNLVKQGKIVPKRRGNRLWFRWRDIQRLAKKRR